MSTTPKRIQRKRTKGWRMPENTVYVGRPTQWGNPFTPGWMCEGQHDAEYWDRAKCIEMFRFTTCPTERPGIFTDFEGSEIDLLPLRGKNLACWCRLDQPCHADILLALANAPEQEGN